MEASKTVGSRKVWRMTAEAPMGEILELLPDADPSRRQGVADDAGIVDEAVPPPDPPASDCQSSPTLC